MGGMYIWGTVDHTVFDAIPVVHSSSVKKVNCKCDVILIFSQS